MDSRFQRHFDACNTARLPGTRLPFLLAGQTVGWVTPGFAGLLGAVPQIRVDPSGVSLASPETLPVIARDLAQAGHYRFRSEAFDVRADDDGPVLATIDRGALPSFGVKAAGVHANGLVRRPDGLHIWVARRAATKPLDPGKLDHLVAGGISAGMGPLDTLIKEAAEEAGLPESLARRAVPVSVIDYAMERPEGLRRDRLHCYDIDLPEDFTPIAEDGEVDAFELWPVQRCFEAVRDTDDFKFNVNLVLIDLFTRTGLL